MSITPSGPPPNDSTQYEVSPTPKWIPLLLVIAFLGSAGAVSGEFGAGGPTKFPGGKQCEVRRA